MGAEINEISTMPELDYKDVKKIDNELIGKDKSSQELQKKHEEVLDALSIIDLQIPGYDIDLEFDKKNKKYYFSSNEVTLMIPMETKDDIKKIGEGIKKLFNTEQYYKNSKEYENDEMLFFVETVKQNKLLEVADDIPDKYKKEGEYPYTFYENGGGYRLKFLGIESDIIIGSTDKMIKFVQNTAKILDEMKNGFDYLIAEIKENKSYTMKEGETVEKIKLSIQLGDKRIITEEDFIKLGAENSNLLQRDMKSYKNYLNSVVHKIISQQKISF